MQAQGATSGWVGSIPTAGQMLLGFMLPFALAFIAVPLESLIHSARTEGGVLLMQCARLAAALALRMAANLVRNTSRLLVHLYDVAIAMPLLIEGVVKRRPAAGHGGQAPRFEHTHARGAPPWTSDSSSSLPALALVAAGCSAPRKHTQAVYMLVDTSGTDAQEAGA